MTAKTRKLLRTRKLSKVRLLERSRHFDLLDSFGFKWHYVDNLRQSIKKINRLIDSNTLNFSLSTDVHYRENRENALEQSEVLSALHEFVDLDFIGCTGDLVDGDETKETTLDFIGKVMNSTEKFNDVPFLTCKGNHDVNIWGTNANDLTKMLTNREWYDATVKPIETHGIMVNPNDPYGGYYYRDFEDKKVRTIWLNRYHNIEDDGVPRHPFTVGNYTEHQLEWFQDTALNLGNKSKPSEWHVAIFSHVVPYRSPEFNHDYGDDRPDIRIMLKSFVDNGGNLIGWFGGHVHADCHAKIDGVNYFISTSFYAVQKYTTPPESPEREQDGLKTLSMNTFVVNKDERKVNVVKSGSGHDWEFTY